MDTRKLCEVIEATVGHRLQTPKDFDLLRQQLYDRLHILISPTTLKRLWGYVKSESEPSQKTLDALSSFLGYHDYADFCLHQSADDLVASNPVLSRHVDVSRQLSDGDELLLTWAPDRQCRLRYLDDRRFLVVSSENTRLHEGDTFSCSLIIEGEPLYISELQQGGNRLVNYVCGKRGGVRFEIHGQ